MADQKIAVRIFFKTEAGLGSIGEYLFERETLEKLRKDFLSYGTINQIPSAAYDCEVMRQGSIQYAPTVLMLKFNEVLYIG